MQLSTRVGGDKAYWVWKVKKRRINRHLKKMKIDLKTELHDYLKEMDLGRSEGKVSLVFSSNRFHSLRASGRALVKLSVAFD